MAKSFLFSASSVLAIDALLPKLWLQNAFHSATKPEEVLAKMGAHCAKSATVDTTPDSSASNQGSAVASNAALEGVPRPRPIVLCGPSGVGKSTLVKKLQAEFPLDFGFSVSHTTRDPRKGEQDGVDYHFVTIPDIEKEIAAGNFVEHAKVHGNYYGTSKKAVADVSQQGRVCVLDIDVQGVQQVQEQGFEVAKYLFIQPPSVADLESRLRARGTETEERIAKRVGNAQGEIDASQELKWDARITNDDLERAYAELRAATAEERQRAAALRDALAAAGNGAERA